MYIKKKKNLFGQQPNVHAKEETAYHLLHRFLASIKTYEPLKHRFVLCSLRVPQLSPVPNTYVSVRNLADDLSQTADEENVK